MSRFDLIAQRGSLNLIEDREAARDDRAARFSVQLRDTPHLIGPLSTARDWFEIDGVRLNGSQAATVRAWAEAYL